MLPKVAVALGVCVLVAGSAHAEDFALRDGDTVVFLGDSITAAQTWGKVVENYTLLRYPDRDVRFINAGQGGDTASGGLARFDRDVAARGATVVIVAFGVNDIGWGTKADAAHKKAYLDGVRGLAKACTERKIRLFLCSAAITAEDPDRAETGFLQVMCDEGMAIAREEGHQSIDVARAMRHIQRKVLEYNAKVDDPKNRESLHVSDGVHLSDLGQQAMGIAILKGLGAPSEVSSLTIDAGAELANVAASGCTVSNLSRDAKSGAITFERLDAGSPLGFGIFGALKYRFLPVPDELAQYMIRVRGLPRGEYTIEVEGRALGRFSADRLEKGINVASATADPWEPGGPWDSQSTLLISLTDARIEITQMQKQLPRYLPETPARAEVASQAATIDEQIHTLQRALVRPASYRWVIQPAKE